MIAREANEREAGHESTEESDGSGADASLRPPWLNRAVDSDALDHAHSLSRKIRAGLSTSRVPGSEASPVEAQRPRRAGQAFVYPC